jgi:hypothetical protein
MMKKMIKYLLKLYDYDSRRSTGFGGRSKKLLSSLG